jgi:hypothetical protein
MIKATHHIIDIKALKYALALLLFAAALSVALPGQTYAASASPGLSIDTCAPGFQPWDITPKIVRCVENSVITAIINMLAALKMYLYPMAAALMALGIALFGIRVVGGEKPGRSAMFLIRATLIAYFWWNLDAYAISVFGIQQEFISIISGGYSPWYQIDNLMGNLAGFGPTLALFQGLIGLLGAALMSSSIGFILGTVGIHAMITLMMFVFNVVYTYLASIIMLGFLVVISPLFLPWAIFFITERYLKKLIDMIIAVLLMPALLFAFIQLFMGIFDVLIIDIIDTIPGGRNMRGILRINNPVFGWVMPSDTSLMERLQAFRNAENIPPVAAPPVGTTVNPFMRHGFSSGAFNLAAVNFGPNEHEWVKSLVYKCIALLLFAHLMKAMVGRIPQISSSIAGSVVGIPLSATSPQEVLKNVTSNAELGAGAAIGGGAGGDLAGGAARAAGGNAQDERLARQGGGIVGALAGMMITKRR